MKYKKVYLIIIAVIILFTVNFNSCAQLSGIPQQAGNEHPKFFYKIYRTISNVSDVCELTFLMSVPYDELQFVFQDSVYKAGYELTITILDMDNNVIETRIKKKKVTVQNFQSTNSVNKYSSLNELFYIASGDYKLIVELMDVDSKLTRIQKSKISITDYYNVPFSMSDVLFLNRESREEGDIYTPNLVANYDKDQKEIYLKFDIYNNKEIDSIDIDLNIQDFSDNTYNTYNYKEGLKGFKTTILLRVAREKLASGNYILNLKIKAGQKVIERKLRFSVNWTQMTSVSIDISSAIEQLRYVATSKKIKEMLTAESTEKKEQLFNDFWDSRDPTPSTEVNELKKEYYSRVAFANKNFSDSREGWLTDRGEVYIVLGPPDNIRRYPHMTNSRPYEVWYYYRFGNNLIFVDDTGLGDYRLTRESWDTYNMLKNQY